MHMENRKEDGEEKKNPESVIFHLKCATDERKAGGLFEI